MFMRKVEAPRERPVYGFFVRGHRCNSVWELPTFPRLTAWRKLFRGGGIGMTGGSNVERIQEDPEFRSWLERLIEDKVEEELRRQSERQFLEDRKSVV